MQIDLKLERNIKYKSTIWNKRRRAPHSLRNPIPPPCEITSIHSSLNRRIYAELFFHNNIIKPSRISNNSNEKNSTSPDSGVTKAMHAVRPQLVGDKPSQTVEIYNGRVEGNQDGNRWTDRIFVLVYLV